MERISLNVVGMSCSHCEKAVGNAISDSGGVALSVSAKDGTAELEYDPASLALADIKDAIAEAGYEVA